MNTSIINATKVAILAGLIAMIGTLWLANLGQTEPVEAAFSPSEPCSDDGSVADVVARKVDDLVLESESLAPIHVQDCGYSRRLVYKTRCRTIYFSGTDGSEWRRVCRFGGRWERVWEC